MRLYAIFVLFTFSLTKVSSVYSYIPYTEQVPGYVDHCGTIINSTLNQERNNGPWINRHSYRLTERFIARPNIKPYTFRFLYHIQVLYIHTRISIYSMYIEAYIGADMECCGAPRRALALFALVRAERGWCVAKWLAGWQTVARIDSLQTHTNTRTQYSHSHTIIFFIHK